VDCVYLAKEGEYAIFLIAKHPNGPGFSLTVQSSFGTWGYNWGILGVSIHDFLAKLFPRYVASKFGVPNDFDTAKFIREIKDTIIGLRREDDLSASEARTAWDAVVDCGDIDSKEVIWTFLVSEAPDFYIDFEMLNAGDVSNRQFSQFWRMFWNPFIEAVKTINFTNSRTTEEQPAPATPPMCFQSFEVADKMNRQLLNNIMADLGPSVLADFGTEQKAAFEARKVEQALEKHLGL